MPKKRKERKREEKEKKSVQGVVQNEAWKKKKLQPVMQTGGRVWFLKCLKSDLGKLWHLQHCPWSSFGHGSPSRRRRRRRRRRVCKSHWLDDWILQWILNLEICFHHLGLSSPFTAQREREWQEHHSLHFVKDLVSLALAEKKGSIWRLIPSPQEFSSNKQ